MPPSRQGNDPDWRFVDVGGQVFGGAEHAQKLLAAGAGRRFAGAIARANLFVPGALVERSDRRLDRGALDHQEPPPLHVAAARRADPGFEYPTQQGVRHGVRLQAPHRPGRANDLEQISDDGILGHRVASSVIAAERSDAHATIG